MKLQLKAFAVALAFAMLSLIVFFIVGMVILYLTDTAKAIHQSGNLLPEEAAART